MIDQLLGLVAPHHCCGCGQIGSILCQDCKNNIVDEPFGRCVACLEPITDVGICRVCKTPYKRSWAVGERSGTLEVLLDGYKFSFQIAAVDMCAELLDDCLPVFPSETVVTAIPTIASHIRQRGFDHASLMARKFASRRGLRYETTLHRANNTKQLGSSKRDRYRQAQRAFHSDSSVESISYLLIDDIFTTGATMKFASETLLAAGAVDVNIAVIARQTLD